MKVQIKQNPYTAWWNVIPVCAEAKRKFRENPLDNQVSTEQITKWMGRDWIRSYMHSEFGTGWITVDIQEAKV